MSTNESETLSARALRLLRYLEHDSSNLQLRLDAIAEVLQCNSLDTADGLIVDGMALHPRSPQLHVQSADVALARGDYHRALSALENALMIECGDRVLTYNKAFLQACLGQYREALETMSQLPSVDGLMTEQVLLSARCWQCLGEPERAVGILECVAAEPDATAEVIGLYALLLHDCGRTIEAVAPSDRALAMDPLQFEARLVRASDAVRAGDRIRAHGEYKKALEVRPNDVRAWLEVARIEVAEGNFSDAGAALQRLLGMIPENAALWLVLGWCHLMNEDAPSCRKAFEQALQLDSENASVLACMAVLELSLGGIAASGEHLANARRIDPDDAATRLAQVLLYRAQGDEGAAAIELMAIQDDMPVIAGALEGLLHRPVKGVVAISGGPTLH